MTYVKSVYDSYARYLQESTVRDAHNIVFTAARSISPAFTDAVVDLGCGLSEFYKHAEPRTYFGLDLNAEPLEFRNFTRAAGDYRNMQLLYAQLSRTRFTAFVSLFSTEITAAPETNQGLYERLFRWFPSMQAGLVSGFYYAQRKHENPVVETGRLISYQTLGAIENHNSPVFNQIWITLPVPSLMFGADVIEVWRILTRKV